MADGQRKGRSLSSLARNVDAHVGRRIRERRSELAVSRSQLAQLLKISQEQVRRYEAGAAAIVASRLHEIGHALGVPASHFFDGFRESSELSSVRREAPEGGERAIPTTRELRRMIEAYWEIVDPMLRRQILTLILAVADSDQESEIANGHPPISSD